MRLGTIARGTGSPLQGQRPGRRRGAAVVEFAILGSVMAVLAVGMVELSRGVQVRDVLNYAVRAACRQGCLPGATNSSLQTTIKNILADNNLDSSQASVTILVNDVSADVSTASQGDKISVQVTVPAGTVSWVQPLFLSGRTVQSTSFVMMKQG